MIFKIIFHLDGTGIYYDPREPIHLDALLAWTLASKQGAEKDLQRSDEPQLIQLPLMKKTIGDQFIWRSSALFPVGPQGEDLQFWRQKFDHKRCDITNGSPNLTNGVYREWNMPLPIILTTCMVAYANGNRKDCKKLLNKELKCLGKKRSQGYGKIIEMEFIEMDEDFSISKGGCATRFLPDKNGIRECRINPPYWNNTNRVKCCEIGEKTIHK